MNNFKYSNNLNSSINILLSLVVGMGFSFTIISCGSDIDMYKAKVYEDEYSEDSENSEDSQYSENNIDSENSLDSTKKEGKRRILNGDINSYLGSLEDILDILNGDDDNNDSDNGIDNGNDKYSDNNGSEDNSGSDNPNVINFKGYKCYSTDMNICEIEYTIFKKTNEYRVSHGLSELSSNMSLSYTARDWSKSQAKSGYISHSGFPNSRQKVLSGLKSDSSLDAGSIGSISAENVAATGYSYSSNAAIGEAFAEMWINSYGHRMNIIGSHKFLGVGVVKSSSGSYSYYATQIFGR